jgi:ubiquinone/menaquinone biosynthesis C-methylase UbiE/uncharacterized protein YbaR (Trm112 family)
MMQDQKSKAGEVKFRARLYEQQVLGAAPLAGELSSEQMLATMRGRIEKTRRDFAELADAHLLKGPFLELGAERCQRSLVLANDFKLEGFAADLSFESLLYADFLAKQEGFAAMPRRICCDALRLPLADNSIGFAFCYQTLHHFPDPAPILQEIYRVLKPGAVLFIDEEPIARVCKLKLWKRRVEPRTSENKYLRYAKDYLLDFVSEPHVNEVDYGICENDDISLAQWERALGQVAEKNIRLRVLPIPKMMSHITHNSSRWGLRSWMCQGLGGILTATIQPKAAGSQTNEAPTEALCCPACRSHLNESAGVLTCQSCGSSYPVRNGIPMLLPREELNSLYAEKEFASPAS